MGLQQEHSGGVKDQDTIIPLGDFDDNLTFRHAGLCSCQFLFSHVLDPVKLRSALETLIEKPGWRKLGSRLRLNDHGRLEIHIPSAFTHKRPAIRFTLATHNFDRAKHSAASRLGAKDKVYGYLDQDELRGLLHGDGTPTALNDFLQGDVPSLGLHVVQFTDSTIVTVQWPHVLFDTMALADVLDAWTRTLNGLGDEIQIQTPYAFDSDPLASLGVSCKEPHSLANHQLSMMSLVSFGVQSGFRFLRSKIQHRMVYVPAWFLQSLRESALQELQATASEGSEPFLSDGDVLCAWWARLSVLHLDKHRHSGKTVTLSNAMSMRPALMQDLLPPSQPFIANSTAIIATLMNVGDVFDQPLSGIASKVRQSITDLRRREQVDAFAALQKGAWKRIPPLFGDHTMHGIMVSNWSKAKLFEADFSGALAEGACGQSPNPGRPVFIQNHFAGGDSVEVVVVIGKDAEGGHWLDCSTNADRWPAIEAALERDLTPPGYSERLPQY